MSVVLVVWLVESSADVFPNTQFPGNNCGYIYLEAHTHTGRETRTIVGWLIEPKEGGMAWSWTYSSVSQSSLSSIVDGELWPLNARE